MVNIRMKQLPIGHYIDEQGRQELLKYKYSGTDSSVYYNYVVAPLAEKLMERLYPLWLAPNVITVTGLALVVLAHMVMCWYCPLLEGEVPAWVYVLCAATLAIYQLLDASDGKQARRTHSGSPLGVMMDHGCDAVNIVVSGITMAATLQMGNTWKPLALVGISATTFFCATTEEYYVGSLDLPGPINGPNEGLLVMYAVHLHAAAFGPKIWAEDCPLLPGLKNHTVFLLAASVCCTTTIFAANVRILSARLGPKGFAQAVWRASPYFLGVLLTLAWVLLDPQNFKENPRSVLWVYGLLYSLLTTRTILAHICKAPLNFGGLALLPLLLVVGRTVVPKAVPGVEPALASYGAVLLSVGIYGHLVVSVALDMRDTLGISIFSIGSGDKSQ